MSRPIIAAPFYDRAGKRRMFERAGDDVPPCARQWHLRIAPGVYAIVTQEERCSWRVTGVVGLDVEHRVEGGPQMAATAAREAIETFGKLLIGKAAA